MFQSIYTEGANVLFYNLTHCQHLKRDYVTR